MHKCFKNRLKLTVEQESLLERVDGCNSTHDRDHNAAKNLWLVGWYYQLTGKVIDKYEDFSLVVIPTAKANGII